MLWYTVGVCLFSLMNSLHSVMNMLQLFFYAIADGYFNYSFFYNFEYYFVNIFVHISSYTYINGSVR